MIRSFGATEQSVRLQMDSYGSHTSLRFLLAGKMVPKFRKPSGEIRYGFSADTIERENTTSLQGTLGELSAASFSGRFLPYDNAISVADMSAEERLAFASQPKRPLPDFEKSIDSMTVEFGNRSRLELHLGRMEQPLQALRACVDDLHRYWGLDPAKQKTLSRMAVPLTSSVERVQHSYPMSMISEGISAYVRFG